MPVAIQIPNVRPDEAIGASELASTLKRVEDAGFDSAWVMEHALGRARALDPLATLAFAAGQTRSIGLGLAVAVLAVHQPVHLAREAATIDYLSDGRLTLGVGIGASVLPYEAFGATARERAPRFEEGLTVMRRLWQEQDVDFDGRFVSLKQANMEPKPVQAPLPVWFGAGSSPALKRTARLADGWIGAGSSRASAFPKMVQELREYLEQEARDPNEFPMGKRAYVAIDRPPAGGQRLVPGRLRRRHPAGRRDRRQPQSGRRGASQPEGGPVPRCCSSAQSAMTRLNSSS